MRPPGLHFWYRHSMQFGCLGVFWSEVLLSSIVVGMELKSIQKILKWS